MTENRFYIEEEGIVIESFTEEPDIEPVFPSAVGGLKIACKIDTGKIYLRKGEVDKSRTVQRLRKRERITIPKELPATDGCVSMLEEESCIMPDAAPNLVTVDIEKLRKAGVPEYVIDMILMSEEELSSLRITHSGRVILPEYQIEIKMPPLDKAFSPELARNYYIDGKSGEPKSIALDRSYVTWETLRF